MSRNFAVALLLSLVVVPNLANAQATETVRYYHTDAIGSVRAITDENGQTIARYDYLPFGEEFPTSPDNHVPLQFAGKERDHATGFDYFGARYYASASGRFTTVDPVIASSTALFDPQMWNRYVYVRNNPLRYTDPDGRCIWDLCIGEIAVAVGVSEAAVATTMAMSALAVVSWQNRHETGQSVIDAMHALGRGFASAKESLLSAERIEGVYEFPDAKSPGRRYVGQSSDTDRRLTVHVRDGRIAPGTEPTVTSIPGGKTAREVAEQRRINELGGTKEKPESSTSNKRNPIGPKRQQRIEDEYGKLTPD